MTAKHTPGRWLIGEDQCVDDAWSIITTSGGSIIANVNDRHDRKANAHLIAAAPDLLEALEEFFAIEEDEAAVSQARIDAAFDAARAAIAKARGQA